jgi:hypothetical protein
MGTLLRQTVEVWRQIEWIAVQTTGIPALLIGKEDDHIGSLDGAQPHARSLLATPAWPAMPAVGYPWPVNGIVVGWLGSVNIEGRLSTAVQ